MRRFLFLVLLLLAMMAAAFLAYQGHRLYEQRQKRKELFLYLQKKSPVTRRMPANATVYINLFDFKRVHSSIQDTPAYKLLTHWLDTGMTDDQKANPLLGGMLEKTILNVIGDEIGLSVIPVERRRTELLLVSRIAPGSDFLLRLALSSNHKLQKVTRGDDVLYSVPTGNVLYPSIYTLIDDRFAYASTSIDRILAARKEGPGPSFLSAMPVEPIPEDTFLMVQSASPHSSTLVSGQGRYYRIQSNSESTLLSDLPRVQPTADAVFSFQTNATELADQPVTGFFVRAGEGGIPVSELLLNFKDAAMAEKYRQLAIAPEVPNAPDPLQPLENKLCSDLPDDPRLLVCSSGTNVLLLSGESDQKRAMALLRQPMPAGKKPLLVRTRFKPDRLSPYLQKLSKGDWSDFPESRLLYLLSCIKSVRGSIDPPSDTIEVELQ